MGELPLMETFQIGAVVVLYNPADEYYSSISKCCTSIGRLEVIDNSVVSNEENVNQIRRGAPKCEIEYIWQQGNNIGLAKALNLGIGRLAELGYKWCMCFDQDISFGNDVVKIYCAHLNRLSKSREKVGIICGQHSYDRGHLKNGSGLYRVEWKMTSGSLVNISAFFDIGEYDERLYIDGLDADYCMRLHKKDYEVLECREAIIVHKLGESRYLSCFGKRIYYGWGTPARYYYAARSAVYIDMHYKTLYGKQDLIKKLIKIVFLFDNKHEYLKAYFRGLKDGIVGNWKTYHSE